MRSHLFAVVLAMSACARAEHPPPPPTPPSSEPPAAERVSIAAVEDGLVPLVHVRGTPSRATLAERMAYYRVPGLSIAVVHEGRIAWAKGYGVLEAGGQEPVTAETLFEAASISKPVTDVAFMTLAQEGRIDLDSSVERWLKGWHLDPADAARAPTARMIMSHHAGFNVDSVGGYAEGEAVPTPLQVLAGTGPSQTPAVRLTGRPGGPFLYSAGGLGVLQQALVDTTGEPFDVLMRHRVLAPLGMTHSTFSQTREALRGLQVARGHAWDGRPWKSLLFYPDMAAAGLRTTATDLAKVVLEVQNALAGKGTILTRASASEMLREQFGGPAGLGFFLSGEGDRRRFSHDGWNYGQTCRLVAYAERGEGAVVMTNQDTGLLMFEVLDAIGRTYGWPDASKPPREAVPMDPAVLARYEGEYVWDQDLMARVMRDGSRLFLKLSHATREMDPFPPAELFAESDAQFFTVAPKMSLRFDVEEGAVLALVRKDADGHETRAPRRP